MTSISILSIIDYGALVIAAILLCLFVATLRTKSLLFSRLPPGPPGIPFFGNLFQVNALRPYPQFRLWALKYGPIFHLRLGPQNVIVLNSAEAVDELFVTRGKAYSGRPSPHVAFDVMSAGQRLVFLPYGKEYKAVRKSILSSVGPASSKRLRPAQDLESRVLLYDLIAHGNKSITEDYKPGPNNEVPEDHWFSLIRRYTTSVIITVVYGRRIHRLTDNPHLHKIYNVLANFSVVAQPGNYIADAFPILRKLPDFLAPWRVEGRRMHAWEMELWGGLLDGIKKDMQRGNSRDCYVGNYLKERINSGNEHAPGCGLTDDGWLKDTLLAYSAGSLLEAGSDTTASMMQSFILFMLMHQRILSKAREEIDRVVGPDRMPTFEDEPRLPYVVACIKETMRRRPSLVMGVPHTVDEDDVYNGYLIPKGSTVIGNVWAIHMDPTRYPNPMVFDPERWLAQEKPVRWGSGPDAQERDHYIFGWGRRYCPGTSMAEASLFIVLSRLLWGIDFQAPIDPKTGDPVIPDVNDEETFSEGFVSTPRIFKASFQPRSEKHASIIEREFEDVQAEWQALGHASDER